MASDAVEALRGRRVLLTGATRGIGLATARRLAPTGARVALVARGEEELRRVAAELEAEPVPGDLATPEGAAAVVAAAEAALGGPAEVLVNAAGSFMLSPIAETTPEEFRRQIDVNLAAPFYLTRALLPGMLARRAGHLVNVGSVAGRVSMAGNGAYSAAKFGLRGLHQVLAEEIRGTGVRATLIEPAATDTSLWDALDPDSRADLPSRSMMLSADDVARAVVFALSQPPDVELSLLALRSAR